ncbi:MAG: hypothetical protein QFB87_05185 [Patescibacteria group bacterium]|nr:hypothetical protein [Patescibacteria group bacterium]
MIIYAKIHTYNGEQQCVTTTAEPYDDSWAEIEAPSGEYLAIVNGVITVLDSIPIDPVIASNNAKQALTELDAKTIRALREGNTQKLAEIEAQAVILRGQIRSF